MLDPMETDLAVHAALEMELGNAHRSGDQDAIFRYAQQDAWCFRSAWVRALLEQWRDEGEDAKLRRVMAAFARNRTKTPHIKLVKEIGRDQEIFHRIVDRPSTVSLSKRFGQLANQSRLSEESIRDIYRALQPLLQGTAAFGRVDHDLFDRLKAMLDAIRPQG